MPFLPMAQPAYYIEAKPHSINILLCKYFHCDLLPQTSQEMAWHIADNGFDIVLSSYVPEIIKSGISSFMQRLLLQSQINRSYIDLYAIHPGGLKILQACELSLNITEI